VNAIPQLDSEAAAAALKRKPDAVYLDVRSPDEFRAGHPAGAFNVPVFFFDAARRPTANADFVAVVEKLCPHDTTILVGCQSGVRSMRAAEMLQARGYADVANVAGGFGGSPMGRGWRGSGLPVERGDPPGKGYDELKSRS